MTITADLNVRHALTQELGARAVDYLEHENDQIDTPIMRRLVITERALHAVTMAARATITGEGR